MMIAKIAFLLTLGSIAAMTVLRLVRSQDESGLEREVAGQLDELRNHLFKR